MCTAHIYVYTWLTTQTEIVNGLDSFLSTVSPAVGQDPQAPVAPSSSHGLTPGDIDPHQGPWPPHLLIGWSGLNFTRDHSLAHPHLLQLLHHGHTDPPTHGLTAVAVLRPPCTHVCTE